MILNPRPTAEELRAGDGDRRRILARGRRLRRRRIAAGLSAVAVAAALIGVTAAEVDSSRGGREVIVGATGSPNVSPCQAGGAPRAGVARVDAGVQFGSLPGGFKPVLEGPEGAYLGETATPGGRHIYPQLSVGLTYGTGAIVGGAQPTRIAVQGRPGQMSTVLNGGLNRVSVLWHPEPDANINVVGYGLPTAQVVAAAKAVRYKPGVTAAAVGDLGPVIPRSAALAVARALNQKNWNPNRISTWLVDGHELAAALIAAGQGGQLITQLSDQNQPYWVVASINTTSDHVIVDTVNATTGAWQERGTATGTTIPTAFAHLPDHSTRQPCPSPS